MGNEIDSKYSMSMTVLPIEDFFDYLVPILNEIGFELIIMTKPVCRDTDGNEYIANTNRTFYGYGTDYTKEEAFKKMGEFIKEECLYKKITYGHTKIAIYQIRVQVTKEGYPPESEQVGRDFVCIWCRYSFSKNIDKS